MGTQTPSSLGVLKGKWVVLVDLPWLPPDVREKSMDLFGLAAEKVTADTINFMARFGRGLICLPMTGERLDESTGS